MKVKYIDGALYATDEQRILRFEVKTKIHSTLKSLAFDTVHTELRRCT